MKVEGKTRAVWLGQKELVGSSGDNAREAGQALEHSECQTEYLHPDIGQRDSEP